MADKYVQGRVVDPTAAKLGLECGSKDVRQATAVAVDHALVNNAQAMEQGA